jgi:integrase
MTFQPHLPACATQRIWTPLGLGVRCTCGADAVEPDREPAAAGGGSEGHYAIASARPHNDLSFRDWAERWLETLERKSTTIGSYRSTIRHAKRVFGPTSVSQLSVEDVARFNTDLREQGCSSSTRAKHLRVLGACLQAAVSYRYADRNPVRELPSAQRPRPERKEAAYFENAELPRLFDALQAEPYRSLCLVALKTGMRQGELIALRWRDIDFDDAVVRVRASYTGGTVTTPKNRERRDVDLISDVVKLLAGRQRGSAGASSDELVFHDGRQRYVSSTALLKRYLYPAMTTAEVPRIGPTHERRTFHSFRHTFAKRALENGAQVTWLSRHLGHSSLKVTTDIYGHWERAERKLQAARMEGAFPV